MPEPLRSEDTDLAKLVARIQAEHGDNARIVYHDTVRRGGVLGFFAREVHRVAYLVDETIGGQVDDPATAATAASAGSVEELLDLADAADGPEHGPISIGADQVDDFAQLLREALRADALPIDGVPLAGVPTEWPTQHPTNDVPTEPEQHRTMHTVSGARDADLPFRGLASVTTIGAGAFQVTGQGADIFGAVEAALAELPPCPELPRAAGEVLALVGPLTPVLATAASLATDMRIAEDDIWIAGLAAHPVGRLLTGRPRRDIADAEEARRVRFNLVSSPTPSIVVVVTDGAGGDPGDPWPNEIVMALAPTATWLLIDATTKIADARQTVAAMPAADALAVHSVRATTSPASARDLGLPIALIDGRRPDNFLSSTMLLGALRSASTSQASA